ncbi:MAG: helix-turn-helix domain-containing protein [Actinomycetota bacterium]
MPPPSSAPAVDASLRAARSVRLPCLAADVSVPRSTVLHTPEGGDVHPPHEVGRVLRLVAEGRNDCQISRETGINRSTIRQWRRNGPPGRRSENGSSRGTASCLDVGMRPWTSPRMRTSSACTSGTGTSHGIRGRTASASSRTSDTFT